MGWAIRPQGLAGIGTAKRIHLKDGKLIGPEGGALIVRPKREGVWIGCHFIKWDAWDELKRQVGAYE